MPFLLSCRVRSQSGEGSSHIKFGRLSGRMTMTCAALLVSTLGSGCRFPVTAAVAAAGGLLVLLRDGVRRHPLVCAPAIDDVPARGGSTPQRAGELALLRGRPARSSSRRAAPWMHRFCRARWVTRRRAMSMTASIRAVRCRSTPNRCCCSCTGLPGREEVDAWAAQPAHRWRPSSIFRVCQRLERALLPLDLNLSAAC